MTPRPLESDPLARMVREHGPSVLAYLVARVRDRHLADDLLQETLLRAWRARHRYEETGRMRAYLLRIAERLACDWMRRRHGEVTVDESAWERFEPADDASDSPLEKLDGEHAQQRLGLALQALSEPQRRTLLLRYYGQLSFEEIARVTGSPLGTVLSHCRRGLVALRALLTEKL